MRWPGNELGKIALVVVPCFYFYRRPRTTSHITAKDTITAKDNITALDAFLHLHDEVDEGDDEPVVVACPLPNPKPGFTLAKKQLGDYTSSQVYLIGDSVIGQLCILGRPGLCCNSRVPCKNNENGELIEGRDPNNLLDYQKKSQRLGIRLIGKRLAALDSISRSWRRRRVISPSSLPAGGIGGAQFTGASGECQCLSSGQHPGTAVGVLVHGQS